MKGKFRNLLLCILLTSLFFPAYAIVLPVSVSNTGEPTAAEIRAAIHGFIALSPKERRMKVREVKKEIRQYKTERKAGHPSSLSKFWLTVIAILLPPLAIYLFEGEIRKCFWISILLTLLFWIPGVIYAIVIINKDWKKYH